MLLCLFFLPFFFLHSFRHLNCGLCSLLHLPFQEAASAIPPGSIVYKQLCNLFILLPYFCYTWCSNAIGHFKYELVFLVVCPRVCYALGVCVTCLDTHTRCGYFCLWLNAGCTADVAGVCLELPLISLATNNHYRGKANSGSKMRERSPKGAAHFSFWNTRHTGLRCRITTAERY